MSERIPSLLELPNLGSEYIHPQLRITKEEENIFWLLDTIHSPGPIYPLDQLYLLAMTYAIPRGAQMTPTPASRGFVPRVMNGWAYMGPLELTDPDKIKERTARFKERLPEVISNWDTLWKKAVEEAKGYIEWLSNFNYETDPDLTDPKQRRKLLEYWNQIVTIYYRDRELNFEFHFYNGATYGAFDSICRELFPGITNDVILSFLQGLDNEIIKADSEFWRIAELARSLGISEIIKKTKLDSVVSELEKSDAGRKWLDEFTKVMKTYGNRTVGGTFNIGYPSWPEDITYPLAFIRGYIERVDKGEKMVPREVLVERREKIIQEYLAKIQKEEDKKRFLTALNNVQKTYPFNENHNFWLDQYIPTLIRLKVIELGRRLVKEGYLDEPLDIFFLIPDEIVAILYDLICKYSQELPYRKVEVREKVKERKKIREEQTKWTPPPVLGKFPEEPLKEPLFVMVWGTDMETLKFWGKKVPERRRITELRGHAASRGVEEGIARVVKNYSELKEIQPGEILVCSNTTPAWSGVFSMVRAIVTDFGGPLSHTAIVGREYGIPVVCGTGRATQVIDTGDRIRVNGDIGLVTIYR